MSLYEGAKTIVRVDSEWSERHKVKVAIFQTSVLPHFIFAVMADVTGLASEC